MSRLIAAVVMSGKATLAELESVYSLEDAYDLLEIAAVENHNKRVLAEQARED